MNWIDLVIIILLICFGFEGLKHGFFKQVVITAGTIFVFYLAYYTKDYIADFLSYNLPFFNFSGSIAGLKSLNIIMYQLTGFLIMLCIFSALLALAIKISGIFEKILKMTIILGIPSKILGFIVGLIEGYVLIFVALVFINQPTLTIPGLTDSSLAKIITKSSPVLSKTVNSMTDTVEKVYVLVDDYSKDGDVDKFNEKSIVIMLDNKIITGDYLEKITRKGKIYFSGVENLINSYK